MSDIEEPDTEEVWRKGCAPGLYSLAIRDIAILPGVSPREFNAGKAGPSAYDPKTVRKYAREMEAGDNFPPVLVGALRTDKLQRSIRRVGDIAAITREAQRTSRPALPLLVLIDGIHRTLGRQNFSYWIQAKVIEIADLDEARWLAIVENWPHGLNLKASEKRKKFEAYMKARKYLDPETGKVKSLRAMAAELGRSHEDIRRKLAADYPRIYDLLRRRDGIEEPEPEISFEDLARLKAEKVQRELVDAAVALARSALTSGRQVEDPDQRARVAGVLEEAAADLRSSDNASLRCPYEFDPDEPYEVEDLSTFAAKKRPSNTDP